jgi:predicted phosphodiesterase
MGRKIIVGDVHGCADELLRLIDLMDLQPDDEVIMVGDLVDRGPDSSRVLQILRILGSKLPVFLVRGNHEQKHVNGKLDGDEDAQEVSRTLSGVDRDQIFTSKLYRKLPEHNALVVHGGIPLGLQVLPDSYDELRGLESRERKRVAQVMYTVHVESDGTRMRWPWAYDGRFGHVYFGHRASCTGDPVEYPHATGLDLGCVYGGQLCCAVLELGKPVQFLKVQANKRYAAIREKRACKTG